MARPTLVDALESLITQEHGWDFLEDKIIWRDTNTGDPPTRAEIDAELKRLQDEYDAQEYQRSRALEYPSIPDQLDEIYHNGIDSWKAVIKKTKDKYPKG
ncbi:MAG: hypothetical protein CMA77_05240 [Euryarchaeota archaeon]|nr:hypothetical protein [Euryarchaeota archaeon]|tara:strand:- start:102 stop:401 length:300 start_codon:yes stop_codon:yes gene_type:complete